MFIKRKDYNALIIEIAKLRLERDACKNYAIDRQERLEAEIKECDKWRERCYELYSDENNKK